jgi:hypothetical protein
MENLNGRGPYDAHPKQQAFIRLLGLDVDKDHSGVVVSNGLNGLKSKPYKVVTTMTV